MKVELLESVQTWPPCGLALAFTPPTDGGGERLRGGWGRGRVASSPSRGRTGAGACMCFHLLSETGVHAAVRRGHGRVELVEDSSLRPKLREAAADLPVDGSETDGPWACSPSGKAGESVCGTARGCYGLPIRPPRLLPRRFAPTRKSVRLQGDETTARWQEDKRPARICPFSRALHEGRTSASLF